MFAPGDIVECVDAGPLNSGGPSGLLFGSLYTVTIFVPKGGRKPDGYIAHRDCLDVAETPAPQVLWYSLWSGKRFRHVYRPDPKLIELLQRAPSELEAA